jgi:DNA-binding NarL/FixJ family response regulator
VSELSILIVDDYPIIRHGLRTLLEARPGWKICSEAATGQAAVQKVKRWKPEIVLLDLGLPDMHGLEVIPRIVEIHPPACILALTEHESPEIASQALASGAKGLFNKSDRLGNVVQGVQALARGRAFHPARVGALTDDGGGRRAESEDPRTTLTARELQILKLLAEGTTNKQVAAALKLSIRTVEAHRASLMRKLDLHSLSDLIYYAIRQRIVRL